MTTNDELMQMLQQGVEAVKESTKYKKYLKTMAAFPSYSANNIMLIFQQFPDASLVAGFQTWKNKFGRHVKRGAKSIKIRAPYKYRVKDDDEDCIEKTGFRVVSVFDISQTEGVPLPELSSKNALNCDVPDYVRIFNVIKGILNFDVMFDTLPSDIKGVCNYMSKSIVIQENMPELLTIKTLLHEGAHSMLHDPAQTSKDDFTEFVLDHTEIREMEAESVAFVVCAWLKLDTSEYSFPYVAYWKRDEQFLPQSLKRIQITAEKIIKAIQQELYPQLDDFQPSMNAKVPEIERIPQYA